jgi:hypothetical protein
MYLGTGILCVVIAVVLVSAGCLSTIFPDPVPVSTETPTSPPTPVPTTESPVATVTVSRMALQPSDIPSDYILKDRSDRTYLEMSQMSLDLGWRAGYAVTYYRVNQEKYDLTGLRQVIDLYPLANMNKVFDIEKEAIESQNTGTIKIYELPCPKQGERTSAYRKTDDQSSRSISTYTIIFTKKDVYEELTMGGTTTDFETLKELAQVAADKIR